MYMVFSELGYRSDIGTRRSERTRSVLGGEIKEYLRIDLEMMSRSDVGSV